MSDRVLPAPNPCNPAIGFYSGECCTICDASCATAPDLIKMTEEGDPRGWTCYVERQPQNDEELRQMVEAVVCSCVENIHYAGDDPKVLGMIAAAEQALWAAYERRMLLARASHWLSGFWP